MLTRLLSFIANEQYSLHTFVPWIWALKTDPEPENLDMGAENGSGTRENWKKDTGKNVESGSHPLLIHKYT